MARGLLVDDDAAGLELRKLILERHGYKCAVAFDPQQASFLLGTKPDVVVLDLRMPSLEEGLALIRAIRARSEVRIIVLCGQPEDLRDQPESNMVHAVLAKPVRPEQLIAAIGS